MFDMSEGMVRGKEGEERGERSKNKRENMKEEREKRREGWRERGRKRVTHLISRTNLPPILDIDDSCELHEPSHVKVIWYPQTVAVSSKIIPLVHIDAIPLVSHYLIEKALGFWTTKIRPILRESVCCKQVASTFKICYVADV